MSLFSQLALIPVGSLHQQGLSPAEIRLVVTLNRILLYSIVAEHATVLSHDKVNVPTHGSALYELAIHGSLPSGEVGSSEAQRPVPPRLYAVASSERARWVYLLQRNECAGADRRCSILLSLYPADSASLLDAQDEAQNFAVRFGPTGILEIGQFWRLGFQSPRLPTWGGGSGLLQLCSLV